MADKIDFMIYGAYGYTGELITRKAVEKGHRPLITGRDKSKLKNLADELKLPYAVFNLTDEETLDHSLQKVHAVIHCAGPFSKTAQLMVYACLRNKVHYLDITGEIEVFEWIASKDAQGKKAGIVLMPGTGFDVVPTDCLAAYLKTKLPDANHLELAFAGGQSLSRGTALTMVENMHNGGMIRENGTLKKVPAAYQTRSVDFMHGKRQTVTIPWGDVSTAYYSTQIPNIKVFTAVNSKSITLMKTSRYIGWLLKTSPVQNFLKKRVSSTVTGPAKEHREKANSYIWGQVSNAHGQTATARLQTPEGYHLTAQSAVLAAELVVDGKVAPGFRTPSMAFGPDFILRINQVKRDDQ